MSDQRIINLSRRQVIRGLLATGAFAAATKLGAGCAPTPQGGDTASSPGASPATDAAKELVLGFIYVGPKDDYGWNQAQATGAAEIAKLPGIKLVEQANVPETKEVQEVMRNMIEQDKVTALFPSSFGYFDPHILEVAKEYKDVQFFHAGTLWKEGLPNNIGSYFALVDEGQYIAGRIAAMTSKSGKLGFVAAKPINPVLRNLNAFILGARSVKPDMKMQVIFTGDWSLPVKEAEATNSLADQGVDVVAMHVDSPKVVIETAEKRNIFCSGFHAVQNDLAPKGYLTGTAYKWSKIFESYVESIRAGKTLMNGGIPHQVIGGLAEGYIEMAPFGAAVSEAAKKDAEETAKKIIEGSILVYKGPIKDNTGVVKIPQGTEYKVTDGKLTEIDWLAEGALGKT